VSYVAYMSVTDDDRHQRPLLVCLPTLCEGGLVIKTFVLFFSRPRSKGWPHHGRTYSIDLCPLSF